MVVLCAGVRSAKEHSSDGTPHRHSLPELVRTVVEPTHPTAKSSAPPPVLHHGAMVSGRSRARTHVDAAAATSGGSVVTSPTDSLTPTERLALCLNELLTTETAYLTSLQRLITQYLVPIHQSGFLSQVR